MPLAVNGEIIDEDTIRKEARFIYERLVEEHPSGGPLTLQIKAREWAKQKLIDRVLLFQAGRDYGAAHPGEVAHEGRESRLNGFVAAVTRDVPKPHRREVTRFYKQNEALFFTPECVHASHIVRNVDEQTTETAARRVIEAAQSELRAGRPFPEVADKYSDCPGNGGDLGWFPRGEMVDEFDAVVFALEPGEVSPIFQSPFGLHIAKLHGRRAAGVRPLPQVYGSIEQIILEQRRDEVVQSLLNELRKKADIRCLHSIKADIAN